MWRRFADWFYMSPKERRGAAVLLLLLAVLVGVKSWMYQRDFKEGAYWRSAVLQNISLEPGTQTNKLSNSRVQQGRSAALSDKPKLVFEEFDPNTVDADVLETMGISSYVANNILRYRSKGGKFNTPDDLLKIYGMDTLWWLQAKRYMVFASPYEWKEPEDNHAILFTFDPNTIEEQDALKLGFSPWQFKQLARYRTEISPITTAEDLLQVYGVDAFLYTQIKDYIKVGVKYSAAVDLNHADSLQLKKIKGIGGYYARQIIALREVLGAYATYDQLLDIKGMDSLRWVGICSQVELDTTVVRKLSVNQSGVDDLSSLPFVSIALAKEIVHFRENFRPFVSVDEVVKLSLFPQSKHRLILPYLTID